MSAKRVVSMCLSIAMLATLTGVSPAAAQVAQEAQIYKGDPPTGFDRFGNEWWSGQEWSAIIGSNPTGTGGIDFPPVREEVEIDTKNCRPRPATEASEPPRAEEAEPPSAGESDGPRRSEDPQRRGRRLRIDLDELPMCPAFPPPPPCQDDLPVGSATTPTSVTNDVMAVEPTHGSYIPDDLSAYPLSTSSNAFNNGAYSGFARIARITGTPEGTIGVLAMHFHIELPAGVDASDLDVGITAMLPDGTVVPYPASLFNLFCYSDQAGVAPNSVYAAGPGIVIVDGEEVAPFITFNAELFGAPNQVIAADTTTVYLGNAPVPQGAVVTNAIGAAITQDGLDGAETGLRDELRDWAEDAVETAIDGSNDLDVLDVNIPMSLNLTWVNTIGPSGGLRVNITSTNPSVEVARNNCEGEVSWNSLSLTADFAVGVAGGNLTLAIASGSLVTSGLDVDLESGFCSFGLWSWAIENAIENRLAIISAIVSFLIANPGVQASITTTLMGLLAPISLGGLLGGAIGLASTVTITSAVVQNGGLELQADASFAPNGPANGPNLTASVSHGPPPNINFLTSLRTVETTGQQFGAAAWLSPDLLNQLVASVVEEGAFNRVDTQGAATAGELFLTGNCGLVDTDAVFVDVDATTAPWLSENPNAGGSSGITTSHLLTITDLRLTFRVANTSCGNGGVVGELSVNVNELGFELTGNGTNQSLGFGIQMHPACPDDPVACPITTATVSNPLPALPFLPGANQVAGATVIEAGLNDLVGSFGASVAMPGSQVGLDIIPMAQNIQPGTVDAYFKILPEAKVNSFSGWETTGAGIWLDPGSTIDLTYSLSASTNMPGPLTYTWHGSPGSNGQVTTTSGSATVNLTGVPVPDPLPATYGNPGFYLQVTDQWGRYASKSWEDDIFSGDWL